MATKDKSFEELVREAPEAPAAHHVSLVGTLSKSHEPGKFVLTLQDGQAVTLHISDVKSHTVLGSSVGQTIVRIEIEAAKASELNPQPLPPSARFEGFTLPSVDATIAWADVQHTIPDIDHPFSVPQFDYTIYWLDHHGTPAYVDYFQGAPVLPTRSAPTRWPKAFRTPTADMATRANSGVFRRSHWRRRIRRQQARWPSFGSPSAARPTGSIASRPGWTNRLGRISGR
jgi:hypothetical protein